MAGTDEGADDTYDFVEAEPPASADSVVQTLQPIEHDLPCRHCGYNLRGLTEERACPECGIAVGRSLLSDQLRFSDLYWVLTLARGVKWLIWSVLLGFLMGLASGVMEAMLMVEPVLVSIITFIPSIIALTGVWMFTSPEPAAIEPTSYSLRSVVRWTTVFVTALSAIGIGLEGLFPIASGVVIGVAALLGIVQYIMLFVFARGLALRVPDYNLAKQTRIVMWGIIICMGGAVLAGLIGAVLMSQNTGDSAFIFMIPLCAFGLGYLVFAIWSLILLFRYHKVATEAVQQAKETWASDIGSKDVYRGGEKISRSGDD